MMNQLAARIEQADSDEERAIRDWLEEELVNNDPNPDRRHKRSDNATLQLTLLDLRIRPIESSTVERILGYTWVRVIASVVFGFGMLACLAHFLGWFVPELGRWIATGNSDGAVTALFVFLGILAITIVAGFSSGVVYQSDRSMHTILIEDYTGGLSQEAEEKAEKIRAALPYVELTVQYLNYTRRRCLVAQLDSSDICPICVWKE